MGQKKIFDPDLRDAGISQSKIINLIADLALKIDLSEKGAASGVAPLNGASQIDPAYLPISSFGYQGVWDANTNTPTITSGVGTNGFFYWVTVAGNTTIDGLNNWQIGEAIIFNGTVWQRGYISVGVSSVNGQTVVVVLDADDIAETATRKYLTSNFLDALNGSISPLNSGNPVASKSDIDALNVAISNAGDMRKVVYDTDNDGVVDDSERLGGDLPQFYLNRNNHFNNIDQSVVNDLVADLAARELLSNKGATNGYPPLIGGKIPAQYLSINGVNYTNTWDANTNTPSLSDGSGTAGDGYIVSVAGTQNLGSGNITFAVGDLIILSSGLQWQKVPTGGVAGVTTWNGLNGVVNATTNDLPTFTDKNYVTDDMLAALLGASGYGAGNPFATLADLPPGTSTTYYITPEQYGAIGSTATLASLGYSQSQVDAEWPGAGATTADTKDWAAWQYCLNLLSSEGVLIGSFRNYYFNRGLNLPTSPGRKTIKGNGCGWFSTNTNSWTFLSNPYPASLSEAETRIATRDSWIIDNIRIVGGTWTQNGIFLNASYNAMFTNIEFETLNKSFQGRFLLAGKMINCNSLYCIDDFYAGCGVEQTDYADPSKVYYFGTATDPVNTQSNHFQFWGCRAVGRNSPYSNYAFDIRGCSGVVLFSCIIEGFRYNRGINWDTMAVSPVKNFYSVNCHFESTLGYVDAAHYINGRGIVHIDKPFGQHASLLIRSGADATAGWVTVRVTDVAGWVPDGGGYYFYNDGLTTLEVSGEFGDPAAFNTLINGTAMSAWGGWGSGTNKYDYDPPKR
jgi:hypothetical protein